MQSDTTSRRMTHEPVLYGHVLRLGASIPFQELLVCLDRDKKKLLIILVSQCAIRD